MKIFFNPAQVYSSRPSFQLVKSQGRYRILARDSAYAAILPPAGEFLLVRDDSQDSSGYLG